MHGLTFGERNHRAESEMMMQKREIFRKCFDNFDVNKIVKYDDSDIERIMNTEGMIRSEWKINAVIHNAKCFIMLR